MNTPLSDDSIKKFVSNVIKYDELENISAKKLLAHLPVVILYETKPNFGHWTLLHKLNNGNIEFFDSYGFKPDTEFKLISPEYQYPHYLMNLLKELSKLTQIHYNQYQLQSKSPGVSTCGRWCILRRLYPDLDIDQFKEGIDSVVRGMGITNDQYVTKAIP